MIFLIPNTVSNREIVVACLGVAAFFMLIIIGTFVHYWVSWPMFPEVEYPLRQTLRSAGFELPMVGLCILAMFFVIALLCSWIDRLMPKDEEE
jgi:hypothetical protein